MTEDSGGYMAKRAKTGSDLAERAKIVGSVAFFVLCGLGLTALLFTGPYGWIFSLGGIALLVAIFLFWPFISSLALSLVQHKPKRAMKE